MRGRRKRRSRAGSLCASSIAVRGLLKGWTRGRSDGAAHWSACRTGGALEKGRQQAEKREQQSLQSWAGTTGGLLRCLASRPAYPTVLCRVRSSQEVNLEYLPPVSLDACGFPSRSLRRCSDSAERSSIRYTNLHRAPASRKMCAFTSPRTD